MSLTHMLLIKHLKFEKYSKSKIGLDNIPQIIPGTISRIFL